MSATVSRLSFPLRWLGRQFAHLHRSPSHWSLQRYAAHAMILALAVWVVVMLGCLSYGLYTGRVKKQFGEWRAFTFYVTFVLATCSVVCWQCSQLRQGGAHRLWRLLAIGFGYLAADELCQFHENIDKFVHWLLGQDPKHPRYFITAELDSLILLLYGLVGVYLFLRYRREFLALRYVVPGGIVVGVLFCLMLFFDTRCSLLIGVGGTWAEVIEEGVCEGVGSTILFWVLVVAREQLRRAVGWQAARPEARQAETALVAPAFESAGRGPAPSDHPQDAVLEGVEADDS